ncbi:hypothetical protein [Salinispora cortesiana]|uniref:hypothetical protein n=1 Tax=Salinispora cortesiana TaxID=1305843 RepID=UPI00041905C9|nr:hypothetical protein [Salinispora cortesiana]
MSYPEPARRPAAVTAAVVLLALMALAAVAYAVAGLFILFSTVNAFRLAVAGSAASSDEIDAVVVLVAVWTVAGAVVSLLAGVLLAALAGLVRTGRNGARVATWVVAGLGVVGGCCGLTVLGGMRAFPMQPGDEDRSTIELLARLSEAYPDWWISLGAGLSVGQVLGYLVVATLLALPPAAIWFRRPVSSPHGPYPPPHLPR